MKSTCTIGRTMGSRSVADSKVSSITVNGDENNGNKNENRIRSIIFDYAERTTLHGVRDLIVGGSVARRFVWFGFVLGFLFYFTYNSIRLFEIYSIHPTMTKQEVITAENMVFPAITICNYNSVRKSKLYAKRQGQHVSSNLREHLDNIVHLGLDEVFQTYGHNMDEDGMFVDCKWKGKRCYAKDFRSSVQSMGFCHTFNSGTTNSLLVIYFVKINVLYVFFCIYNRPRPFLWDYTLSGNKAKMVIACVLIFIRLRMQYIAFHIY